MENMEPELTWSWVMSCYFDVEVVLKVRKENSLSLMKIPFQLCFPAKKKKSMNKTYMLEL